MSGFLGYLRLCLSLDALREPRDEGTKLWTLICLVVAVVTAVLIIETREFADLWFSAFAVVVAGIVWVFGPHVG